ncbi:hypothetical protein G6F70_003021 [Rhizopus microsporus]|uniref:Pet127-domain-containing protein n=1 Tax=Rhizopus microsporus TaxID=58291 RepID=A0A1X0SEH3_RHIZD|nr:hypothetical protein G6F71_002325 [Rhizopus microsporus]KAG1201581.1 hypothetical protein G6F70_003021 [Rhizopus microsporus]KAG1214563.1 hypothetical protein G6F69_001795 [Rhizopus microsporus]KAG1238948.1 hypothetical protein G6F67_000046 [Rhizopus microsporus]KAG1267816.1 hypothetical protein G6F68_001621 [Rhizopus microsporus]
MFLLSTGTHWTLCFTAKRLLTTTIPKRTLKKVIDNGQTVTEIHVVGRKKPRSRLSEKLQKLREEGWKKIDHIKYKALAPPKEVEVAKLAHGLDKVLFRRGVHYLKDPVTHKYNFTPYLEFITQPANINFDALPPYITSSKDNNLIEMARKYHKRYVGSTSSVSATLSQFYFAMSNFKRINITGLSSVFQDKSTKFTRGTQVAATIYLRWKDGVYAIDADKAIDGDETILSVMGKSLEKVLTLEPNEFEKYLKDNQDINVEEERNRPESYAYGHAGKFLLRSQLDCYHPNLKRKTFDLKTRAAIPVRLDVKNYEKYVGYRINRYRGYYESYEREYYDMIRSAFLKYSFQVRIGHMDGILVAYHNTRKIFGFQYISRNEMDLRLFGSRKIGDQVFNNSLTLLQTVLDTATQKYPESTLRISFNTVPGKDIAKMYIYVEKVPPGKEDDPEYAMKPYEEITEYKLEVTSFVNGKRIHGPLTFEDPHKDMWRTQYKFGEVDVSKREGIGRAFEQMRKKQASVASMTSENRSILLTRLEEMSIKGLQEELKQKEKQGKIKQEKVEQKDESKIEQEEVDQKGKEKQIE